MLSLKKAFSSMRGLRIRRVDFHERHVHCGTCLGHLGLTERFAIRSAVLGLWVDVDRHLRAVCGLGTALAITRRRRNELDELNSNLMCT